MPATIRTIEGNATPTPDDLAYMEYLNEIWDIGDFDFGLLLYKGDPVTFRLGRDEWIAAKED